MTFRSLSADAEPAREIPATLPWVHAAGQPYIDWLLGGPAAALKTLDQWMRRPSSEVFIGRVVVVEEGRPLGGFIALSGAELTRCRMQDAVAAAATAPAERRPSVLARLRLARELFSDVFGNDLYLSRMGILPEARRHGYGTAIVREYLRDGMRRGFPRFALDVWSGNQAAIRLYRSVGFRAERQQEIREVGMTYVRMVLQSDERVAPPLPLEARHQRRLGMDHSQQLRVAGVDERAVPMPEQTASPHNGFDEAGL